MKQVPPEKALKLLMFAVVGTPDGKPRLLTFPPGEAPQYDRRVSTHEAIRSSEEFPGGWQLDLMLLSGIKQERGIAGRFRLLGARLRVARLALWAYRSYDVLICGQVTLLSCLLGVFQQMFFWRRPALVVREFMLGYHVRGTPNRLKRALVRLVFRKINLIVCSSRKEASHYCRILNWSSSRVAFIPLTSLRLHLRPRSTPQDRFILSAGRTGRDYATLLAAVRELDVRVQVICSPRNLQGLEIPSNVHVLYDTTRKQYEAMMEECEFMVIPLLETKCSTGQRVMEAAMSCERAVIITNTAGTEDYMINGETGVTVEPGDVQVLRNAIDLLWRDKQLRERLARQGREHALKHFSNETYAKAFLVHLKRVLNSKKA